MNFFAASRYFVSNAGDITLKANQQAVATGGTFEGVAVYGMIQSAGSGKVTVQGRGGAAGGDGVYVEGSIASGGGGVQIAGIGGSSSSTIKAIVLAAYSFNFSFSSSVKPCGRGSGPSTQKVPSL